MNSTRFLARMSVVLGALVLAACGTTTPDSQTTQSTETTESVDQDQTTQSAASRPETDRAAEDRTTSEQAEGASAVPEDEFSDSTEASADGEQVAVFVADFDEQDGWHPVPLDSGNLYINPEPIVMRNDLAGVQAGKSEDDEGLLALSLTAEGQERVTQATTQYPGMRLALIVGNTLLAAPGYSEPVVNEHLIFAVGTEENAMAVARAIAGVDEDDPGEGAGSEPAAWD